MVEELIKLNYCIMGVVVPKVDQPKYDESFSVLFPNKKDKVLKICLLEDKNTIDYSTKEMSKIQLATKINNEIIELYDFSKGLNNKELKYFKLLFKKISSKYNKKIILISRDIDFLSYFCDTIVIYDKKIIYSTTDIFDDRLYHYIDMPQIVKFIKLANKKGAGLTPTLDLNELIKDIYRRKN